MNMALELLLADESNGSAREDLPHGRLQSELALFDGHRHVGSSTFRPAELHPIICMAVPSHPE